jgi:hypothetical protein
MFHFFQILILLANLLWSHSGQSLKLLRQMTLARKADLKGNICGKRSYPKGLSPNLFSPASFSPVPRAVKSRTGGEKFPLLA